MKKFLRITISNKWAIFVLYFLFALTASIQAFYTNTYPESGTSIVYTDYNNYVIFKNAYFHLIHDQDLYQFYPTEQYDLYKYTPIFAAGFGIFAYLPDAFGLFGWNLLNVLCLWLGIYLLPRLTQFEKGFLLLLVVIELITSIQNEQSNGLMVGLLVAAVGLLERGKYQWATLLVVISVYIKLFSIISLVLFLFYPKKFKLASYTALWFVLLFIVPLLFISFDQYLFLWKSFGEMLRQDHSASYGYSVMGILNSWFSIEPSKVGLVLVGLILLLVPYLKIKAYRDQEFRLLALASLLIWTVIFNHKAESPTFIIALVGMALWFVMEKKNWLSIALFVFAIVLTSLSSTDLFPKDVRDNFIKPYALKALPSVIVWCVILVKMIRYQPKAISKNG